MLARLLLACLCSLLLVTPAEAAVSAKVSVSGGRLVVTVKGVKAKAVTVVAAGKTYKLSKSGTKWRSKPIAGIAALAGSAVKVKVRSAKGTKTLTVTLPGTPPAPVAPAPVAPAPTAPVSTALFPPPAAATTGDAAFNEIRAWAADSTFTDCPAGWPNCSVEQRYSHFADGTQWYCRLTPTSGSDIRSRGDISKISGAEHNADGSWGFEYSLSSYGNTVFYSWSVSPMGVVTGRYWGPGRDPSTGPPSENIGPLQYVRGAKDCSY